MSLKYVIKKRTFGFDKTKTEKYVAQNVITNTLDFRNLCDEITKVGLVPSGAVKFVLDALIDTLNMNLNKGISVQLGDFGCFRPSLNCDSQDTAKDVDSDTIRRVKIIFTPGTGKSGQRGWRSSRSGRITPALFEAGRECHNE